MTEDRCLFYGLTLLIKPLKKSMFSLFVKSKFARSISILNYFRNEEEIDIGGVYYINSLGELTWKSKNNLLSKLSSLSEASCLYTNDLGKFLIYCEYSKLFSVVKHKGAILLPKGTLKEENTVNHLWYSSDIKDLSKYDILEIPFSIRFDKDNKNIVNEKEIRDYIRNIVK